ncbi:MAG TPA: exo-alpha-sialidase, partial [Rhodanobacter sp.]
SCECCRLAIARTPQGDVAVFFRSIFGDNIRDHAYALLHTNGQPSHAERATFNQWQIAACPEHGPGLAIGADGTRHAVWYESKDKPTIWYGQLDPGHPPQHAQVVANAGASHADVAVHGKTVWITWNQVGANGYALMLQRSLDNGAHFDAAREIAQSVDAVGSPQLLQSQGRAFVAWNTAGGFRLIPLGAP